MSAHELNDYGAPDRQRFVSEDPAQKSADRDDFARDRARVLHSAALRRLAAKTQVLQPDSDDFIRNRLTHSLEVAQIGREIASALGCSADVVDTACLAHDLGHPPYGHNGERALDAVAEHIGGFEGNAQTFRLLTRIEAKRSTPQGRSVGLNLTRASLDAASKYPWTRSAGPYPTPKFGCYADDLDIFEWVRSSAPTGGGRRCLEAQVMDWADDVAYSVHDVEDGVTSGLIDLRVLGSPKEIDDLAGLARELYAPHLPHELLVNAASELRDSGAVPLERHAGRASVSALKDMTSRLIGWFVREAVRATRVQYGAGRLLRYDADLVVPDAVLAECVLLKATAARYVMLTDERGLLMARQRDELTALVELVAGRPDLLDPVFAEDHHAAADDGARLRVVIDQVASMTDLRARAMTLAHL
ncbi:deoxyguanosinetriphosphate triphosphohydrolase [Yimella sp. cx-51]|uniref:deoxyguanosinetriphosphate triphosphohydrolase n=1 Tax=Yimella sp. cx-51 TaxID=2770551 RepID=UPI00165D8262|nr:deoxyguanosinetriphosphate triphosphohydrolase [Yimella sp. cx-51]MBC9956928.1 deoxyguanosinetriphosphate triphosphohydrolase [Yimella sp. cx-51]QTH39147.1 deoxyguanosinetriphosphate triphosphohydrolase [Yimella sp. cx-51]